tara:strand:+ start:331 stop:573 length:243 start_codon:yes stop_codon:yes gene_type:complete
MPRPSALKTPLRVDEFYCVGCRKRCKSNPEHMGVVKFKNGAVALNGYCRECDCEAYKFIKRNQESTRRSQYGNKKIRKSP